MSEKRVQLYERLPEIYRIKDEEQNPPGQLKNYLGLVEDVFGAIHENIESLYDNLFIETCEDWVIPYIADLLGTSHLKGEPWTLRADVADTVALRRRKGTLGAIEQLTYDLTQWGVHCVELRENLVWSQHLNHQRPDMGGKPPYAHKSAIKIDDTSILRTRAIRGGTVTLRNPAILSLVNTPFDPFAHTPDLKPPEIGNIRYNLPNLAISLWRLKAYRIDVSKPKFAGFIYNSSTAAGFANFIVRINFHPMGEPVMLFNTYRLNPDEDKPILTQINELTQIDETPCPITAARLTKGSAAGNCSKYVNIETYGSSNMLYISNVGLQIHFPLPPFSGESLDNWSVRGANLCAWEDGLNPPLKNREMAIDPAIGRIAIGVDAPNDITAREKLKTALENHLLLTYTYGAVGPVGAHPISRHPPPSEWNGETFVVNQVNLHHDPNYDLNHALNNIGSSTAPIIIEINDSMIHKLDLTNIGISVDGSYNLQLNRSLIIRASDNQRPIIKLAQPLRFRPLNVSDARNITVRLEGLYITRDEDWDLLFTQDEPLIARAALNSLEIIACTLDPGGSKKLDGSPEGTRTPIHTSMKLWKPYGFTNTREAEAFKEIPEITVRRSITGPLLIDRGYYLILEDSIIDAGSGINENSDNSSFAVSGATGNAKISWGPETEMIGITVFGRMRVERISGSGGIWVHALEAFDNQKGCVKYSYFSGKGDRLPPNHACVKGDEADLQFTSEVFGNPAYGQLAHTIDFRIRERGPKDDAMGAFGFMMEAHKWRNLQIRYREFMPVGVRLLMIPVT